jgi:hypothetical protein
LGSQLQSQPSDQQTDPKYYVAAYIWSSCHDEKTSWKIWSNGIGEWEVIKKGKRDVAYRNNTPQNFAVLLQKTKEYADSHPEQPKIITVNAWNEWVEGSYLLPDKVNGFGYLET